MTFGDHRFFDFNEFEFPVSPVAPMFFLNAGHGTFPTDFKKICFVGDKRGDYFQNPVFKNKE